MSVNISLEVPGPVSWFVVVAQTTDSCPYAIFTVITQSSQLSRNLHSYHAIFTVITQSSQLSRNLHSYHAIFTVITQSSQLSRNLRATSRPLPVVKLKLMNSLYFYTVYKLSWPVVLPACSLISWGFSANVVSLVLCCRQKPAITPRLRPPKLHLTILQLFV